MVSRIKENSEKPQINRIYKSPTMEEIIKISPDILDIIQNAQQYKNCNIDLANKYNIPIYLIQKIRSAIYRKRIASMLKSRCVV